MVSVPVALKGNLTGAMSSARGTKIVPSFSFVPGVGMNAAHAMMWSIAQLTHDGWDHVENALLDHIDGAANDSSNRPVNHLPMAVSIMSAKSLPYRSPLHDRQQQRHGSTRRYVELARELNKVVEQLVRGNGADACHCQKRIVAAPNVLDERLAEIKGAHWILEEPSAKVMRCRSTWVFGSYSGSEHTGDSARARVNSPVLIGEVKW